MSTDLQNALSAVTGSPPHAIPRHKAPYRHGHSELHVGLRVSSTCAYRDCRLVCRGLRLNGASDPSLSSNPTPHCTAHRARCPPRLISPPPSPAPIDGVAAASGRSQRGRRCRARIPKAERFGAVEERRKWSDREGQHAARRRDSPSCSLCPPEAVEQVSRGHLFAPVFVRRRRSQTGCRSSSRRVASVPQAAEPSPSPRPGVTAISM